MWPDEHNLNKAFLYFFVASIILSTVTIGVGLGVIVMFVDFCSAGGVVVVGFIEVGSLAQFNSCSCFWLLTPVGKTFKEKKTHRTKKWCITRSKTNPAKNRLIKNYNWFLLLWKTLRLLIKWRNFFRICSEVTEKFIWIRNQKQ